jgi:probable rRNA maturation factor
MLHDARYLDDMSAKRQRPNITIVSEQSVLRVPRKRIEELVEFVARAQKVRFVCVDILILDDRAMGECNWKYLKHRGPTDVISFDLSESSDAGLTAQLIISAETARREGPINALGPQAELLLYVLHGLLHVIGHDDQTPEDRDAMTLLQNDLLAAFRKR